jgi:hypothetical protein
VARIAESLAALRGVSLAELAALTRANAFAVMPKLARCEPSICRLLAAAYAL